MSLLGIVLLLMRILVRQYRVSSVSFFYAGTDSLTFKCEFSTIQHFSFGAPWSLSFREQCLNINCVMCVIAHHERYVGFASLCPLIHLSHLCGGLAVWILFTAFDKGTHTIFGSVIFLCLASNIALNLIQGCLLLKKKKKMYCRLLFNLHPSIHSSKATWEFNITIKTRILF